VGGGAHLRALRRTAIGPFREEEAHPLDALGLEHVLPMGEAVRHLEPVVVGPAAADAVGHGRPLLRAELGHVTGPGPWAVVDHQGALLAVYEAAGEGARASVVLAPHQ